jgi:hypothetical protein
MRTMRARRRTATVNNASRDGAFSRKVKERDGNRCRMQVWHASGWLEHSVGASSQNPLDAAHIYPRGQCGKFWDEPIVGVTACRDCHDRYDGKQKDGVFVRVPPERERAAYLFLATPGRLKSPPARRQQTVFEDELA